MKANGDRQKWQRKRVNAWKRKQQYGGTVVIDLQWLPCEPPLAL